MTSGGGGGSSTTTTTDNHNNYYKLSLFMLLPITFLPYNITL